MASTKQEVVDLLSSKKEYSLFTASTWDDLNQELAAMKAKDRDKLVELLVSNNTKDAGNILRLLLLNRAKYAAIVTVENALSDDTLTLQKLYELLG